RRACSPPSARGSRTRRTCEEASRFACPECAATHPDQLGVAICPVFWPWITPHTRFRSISRVWTGEGTPARPPSVRATATRDTEMLGFHRRRLSARQGALTRTLIVGALSLACLASLSLRATAASAASLPPQGIYEECAPSDQQQCAGELAQISRAGFQLVVNYTAWEGTASDLQTYAATAAADHLQVIWPVDAPAWTDSPLATSLIQAYPALAASCGCVNNQGFINYVVGLVKTFPATWGYYVGDEDGPSQALPVSLLSLSVRTLDPSHQTLYVGQSGPSVYSQLRLFQTDASYLGADVYPVGTGAPLSVVSDAASQLQTLAAPIHRN